MPMLTLMSAQIDRVGDPVATESRLLRLYEQRRAELRMSDADVMRAAGLSGSWIATYRTEDPRRTRGRRAPQPESLRKLARGLQLPYRVVAQAAAEDYYEISPVHDGDRYTVWGAMDDLPEGLSDEEREQIAAEMIERLRRWQEDEGR